MDKKKTYIKLELAVFGTDFDPDDLTEILKIEPSEVWRIGDQIDSNPFSRRNSAPLQRKESAWAYSDGFLQTLDFDILTSSFIMKFKDVADLIRDFVVEHKLEVSVNVEVTIVDGRSPSLNVPYNFISLLERMGSELDFDVYA